MKFGDQIRGRIAYLDDKGRGAFDGYAVPFTGPGDEIESTFVKRDKGVKVGRLERVVIPSPDRVAAPCPHAGVCGGCLWQHLAYDAQLRLKRDMINRAFKRAGHAERVESVMPSPETLYYRNRMDYAVGWKGEVGLKEYGSWNRYLDLSTCLLLDKETPVILQTVRELMQDLDLKPWDAKRFEGDLRYCVIRLGRSTGERMITLIVQDTRRVDEAAREKIKERLGPFATALYLGENPEITDVSLAKTLVLLHGKEFLEETVNGFRYFIHPNSFFQTNTRMAAELQTLVVGWIGNAPRILDLFCGSGFFAMACAKQGSTVYGHEIDAHAIELAAKNADANDVGDAATFGAGPVEKFDWSGWNADAVIVDPPRAGLHPKALKALLEDKPPVIVYVSCNYHRLADELRVLKSAYRVEKISALDLFPHTPHVEVIAKLTRT